MADKPILKIPVDTEEWDEFVDSFMKYQKLLEAQGDAWAASNKGIKEQKNAFDDVDKSFSDLVDKARKPQLGESMVKVTKSSKETEKSWRNISRELDKSAKSLSGLARTGLSFSSFGGLLGLGGLASLAGGVFASNVAANNALADQNIMNRKLGLKPGEEQAFDTVYKKAGGDSALLGRVATAQATPSQWRYLQAAGVSSQDIQTKTPEELSELFLKNVGSKVRQLGPTQFGQWAQATGVTNFADVNSLRQAGSYSNADYAGMHQQYQQLQPQLAAQQKTLDEATAARQQLESQLAKSELELEKAFIQLNPVILDLTHKGTDLVTAFAESGQLKKGIEDLETAFTDIGNAAEWVADKLNSLFGLKDKKEDPNAPDFHVENGGLASNLMSLFSHPIDYLSGKDRSTSGWDINVPFFGNKANSKSVDQSPSTGNPALDRLLDATRYVESHGNANAIGPVTKEGWQAKGAYQFSPADLDRYGVADPFNERAERQGAARKYRDLAKKYGGNTHEMEAAYNWGEGNVDQFLKNHKGSWDESALPPGVQAYLRKMDARMTQDDAGAKIAQAADAKVAQAAKGGFVGPVQNPDNVAVAAMADRLKRGFGTMGDTLRNTFSDGGGARFRSPDPKTGAQAPYNINVVVTSPAGSSTTVTAGGVPQ